VGNPSIRGMLRLVPLNRAAACYATGRLDLRQGRDCELRKLIARQPVAAYLCSMRNYATMIGFRISAPAA
jgi:hypothetical protein